MELRDGGEEAMPPMAAGSGVDEALVPRRSRWKHTTTIRTKDNADLGIVSTRTPEPISGKSKDRVAVPGKYVTGFTFVAI